MSFALANIMLQLAWLAGLYLYINQSHTAALGTRPTKNLKIKITVTIYFILN